jgi:hypothetical protein
MASDVVSFPGARWWKFDFHTHTPASCDAKWPPGSLSPEQWLLKFMAAKIDCVAITDHNTGNWIDKLKAAYASMQAQRDAGIPVEGFRPITSNYPRMEGFMFSRSSIPSNRQVQLIGCLVRSDTTARLVTAILLLKKGFPRFLL